VTIFAASNATLFFKLSPRSSIPMVLHLGQVFTGCQAVAQNPFRSPKIIFGHPRARFTAKSACSALLRSHTAPFRLKRWIFGRFASPRMGSKNSLMFAPGIGQQPVKT
jgi:hypothetical protein